MFTTVAIFCFKAAYAQTDTTAVKKVTDTTDYMKEFDEYSFRNASKAKVIKDSSKLSAHLIGVKAGFSMNNVTFNHSTDHKALTSYKNFGLYYTYYHSLWNSVPLFGIETGIQYNEEGYKSITYTEDETVANRKGTEGEEKLQCIEIPLVSQFRIDFWRMRILLNAGAFGSYKHSVSFSSNVPDSISTSYRKFGYGFIVGGGLGYIFNPFEIHVEVNYKYNFANLYNPEAFSDDYWMTSHTNQLIISAGLFFRIDKYGFRKNGASSSRKSKKSNSETELAPKK